MPFDDEFDDIYNEFLHDTLTRVGFAVSRADELQGAQNILRDIVTNIAECDLIIADLTGSNPNVYYELGLAHASNKSVILLTQDIDALPFDLKGYRVIDYTTRFSDILRAKDTLATLATGFMTGEINFGNPITDFGTGVTLPTRWSHRADAVSELGILDYTETLETGTDKITATLSEIGERSRLLVDSMTTATGRFDRQKNRAGRSANQERIAAVRALAQDLDSYATFLAGSNQRYSEALEDTQAALEEIVRFQDPQGPESRQELDSLVGTLGTTEETVKEFRETIREAVAAIESMPRVEKTFNRARTDVSNQLRYLVANAERTISMLSRAREIGSEALART